MQVINVPGAGGTVGLAQFVNGAKGDGNQLMVNGFVMVGAHPDEQIAGVDVADHADRAASPRKSRSWWCRRIRRSRPRRIWPTAVKTDIAKVTFAGGSAGGVDHIMAALFVGAVGADATKINYIPFSGGGELLAAILGGKVTAGISGFSEYDGQIKAGKLRAIGVTSPERHPRQRHPDLQGAGHRPRAHQLALGVRRARHHRRAEEDARRRWSRSW